MHYKITDGPAYLICQEYNQQLQKALQQLAIISNKYNASKVRYQSCGTKVVGLYFGPFIIPSGWKRAKGIGYCTPNKRNKLGKEIAAELDTIKLPCTELLAINLGCPKFFIDLNDGRQYCSNIDIFHHNNTTYLDAHTFCSPDLKKYPEIVQIPASEWHKASEEKEKAR